MKPVCLSLSCNHIVVVDILHEISVWMRDILSIILGYLFVSKDLRKKKQAEFVNAVERKSLKWLR